MDTKYETKKKIFLKKNRIKRSTLDGEKTFVSYPSDWDLHV